MLASYTPNASGSYGRHAGWQASRQIKLSLFKSYNSTSNAFSGIQKDFQKFFVKGSEDSAPSYN